MTLICLANEVLFVLRCKIKKILIRVALSFSKIHNISALLNNVSTLLKITTTKISFTIMNALKSKKIK